MKGRPRSVEDVTIVEAVRRLIAEGGPAGVTLAAVAKRVRLSAPALTQRFGSKHGLLVAFAKHESASLGDVFLAARERSDDALSTIVRALATLPSAITTRGAMANSLAFLQLDLADRKLRDLATAHSRALRAELRALVKGAILNHELVPEASAEGLTADLYATYCGAMLTWAIDGRGRLSRWIREHVERTLAPHRVRRRRRRGRSRGRSEGVLQGS